MATQKNQKKKVTNNTKKAKNILIAQNSLKNSTKKNVKNNALKNKTYVPKKSNNKINTKELNKKKYEARVKKATPKKEIVVKKELNLNDNVNKEVTEQKLERLEKTVKLTKKKDFDKLQRLEKTIRISKAKKEEQAKAKELIQNVSEEKKIVEEKKNKERKIEKLSSTLVNVKEKTSDKNIPHGNEKNDKKRRIKRYLLESIVFSLIITFINLVAIKMFNYANYLRIFDIKWVNILLTVVLSLIFSYAVSFFVDCLITELMIKYKAKREGVQNGSEGLKQGEYQEDIENKE